MHAKHLLANADCNIVPFFISLSLSLHLTHLLHFACIWLYFRRAFSFQCYFRYFISFWTTSKRKFILSRWTVTRFQWWIQFMVSTQNGNKQQIRIGHFISKFYTIIGNYGFHFYFNIAMPTNIEEFKKKTSFVFYIIIFYDEHKVAIRLDQFILQM